MGGIISSETNLAENVPLQKLSDKEIISDNDPFWNNLFSFNLKIDDSDASIAKDVDDSVAEHLQRLMDNSRESGNFSALIRAFLRRSTVLKESAQCENKIFLWQTGNALVILRYALKFLTQRLSETEFIKVFDKSLSIKDRDSGAESDSDDDSELIYVNTAEEFLDTLLNILIDLPVSDLTLPIHIEAVKCCIILLSTQLYREDVVQNSIVFSYFLTGVCQKRSPDLTKSLLRNYLQHNSEYKITPKKDPESIVLGIAGSLWSMVSVVAGLEEANDSSSPVPLTLGGLSILLLLNLACHSPATAPNPFKETLAVFQNAQEVSTVPTAVATFKIDYSTLYERLCATVNQEPPMLLLYLLLHRNLGFRNYVLSRINLENLVLPVLRILHDGISSSSTTNSHHMYLALIVILILSEDDFFCKIVHETMLRNVDWVDPDRPVGEISLGGLTALVFIRTIQKNTIKMRDRYLHTNCLAALANMSSAFKQLSPLVCQKMVALLELLTKRHAKMVEHMRMNAELDVQEAQQNNYHDDITALEEGIRTLLEITNSALTGNLRHNPNLIYTLLYHKTLFGSYREHPMFQDLLKNITAVIDHFSEKIVGIKDGGSAILCAIEKEAVQWPSDRLTKFPELKFRYVEDDNTIDFFVPYVWRLSFQHSSIRFEPSRIRLFNALLVSS